MDFTSISNLVKGKAEEVVKSTRSGGKLPEITLAITDELLKQMLEFVVVKVNEVREEVKDQLKKKDEKISELQEENRELRYQLDASSQYNRRDNLKIIGVKYDKNEDVKKIVKDIAAHVGEPIEDKDISVAHRLNTSEDKEDSTEVTPTGGKPKLIPSIIVKFVRRDVKTAIFNARKQNVLKPGSPHPDAAIYEDVTPLRSRIMYQLRNRKDDQGNKVWRYVWSREGRIYCRTQEESEKSPQPKPKIVNRVEDLKKLGFSDEEITSITHPKKRA